MNMEIGTGPRNSFSGNICFLETSPGYKKRLPRAKVFCRTVQDCILSLIYLFWMYSKLVTGLIVCNSKIHRPWLGGIMSTLGVLSYTGPQGYSIHGLAGRYGSPMLEATLSPLSGTMNLARLIEHYVWAGLWPRIGYPLAIINPCLQPCKTE